MKEIHSRREAISATFFLPQYEIIRAQNECDDDDEVCRQELILSTALQSFSHPPST